MKTRIEIEDTVQALTCKLLPKMPPEYIRPAYQQADLAGKVLLSDDGSREYAPFMPDDNFIYIKAKLGPGAQSSVAETGDVEVIRNHVITYSIYGEQSSELALSLFSLLRTEQCRLFFESHGIYIFQINDDIEEFREIINEQWVERHDFTFTLTESAKVRNISDIDIGKSVEVKTIHVE